ncbi:hypothetical protein DPV78_004758 [Talaromyces pinophilus]|nr:hypothetical protein DPV78_004758 [Talaromyces pinophilus]
MRGDLNGYKFRADPATIIMDAKVIISLETAVSYIHTLYDAQSTLGLLLPISKDFMLTIPSIIDNPYVQVDVRMIILYYGALHQGMLLSPDLSIAEKNKYELFFYRKTLQYIEQWLVQDNVNELSLHVAFWMTHEAYSQLDFDLAHRLHGRACQIARDLGLMQLDADTPSSSLTTNSAQPPMNPRWSRDTMGTVYRDVHRIYFWHILIANDYAFGRHLYRSSNIDLGTWKVDLPDFSTRQSLSDIKEDTQICFEASLRLSLIEVKYSELVKRHNGCSDFMLDESQLAEIRELSVEIETVLAEWKIEQLMMQTSSKINTRLYAHLIWRATSMVTFLVRDQGKHGLWPLEHDRKLENEAAHRSIRAMQRLFDLDQDGLYWNLGNILSSKSEELAASELTLASWVQTVVRGCAERRHELKSLELFLQTLNHHARLVLQKRFPAVKPHAQTHRGLQNLLPSDTAEPKAGQIMNSDVSLLGSLSTESLNTDEVEFLRRFRIIAADLDFPPLMDDILEKCLLAEPDPHRQWWFFES